MKVAYLTDVEIGSQGYFITKALNKYTKHKARCITLCNNYIGHFTDHWLGFMLDAKGTSTPQFPEYEMKKRMEEAKAIIEDSDFFIFRRDYHRYYLQYMKQQLTPYNHMMIVFGSECRDFPAMYWWMAEKQNVTLVTSHDYTNSSFVGFNCQHMPISLDMKILPQRMRLSNSIRLCHASTNRNKKLTNKFLEIAQTLPIELVLIEGKNWKESLELKATCDMSFDQIFVGSFGMSSVESMGMGQVSLAYINGWVRSMYPDIPIVDVTAETMANVIQYLVKDRDKLNLLSQYGISYVKRMHDLPATAPRWDALIKFVTSEKQNLNQVAI